MPRGAVPLAYTVALVMLPSVVRSSIIASRLFPHVDVWLPAATSPEPAVPAPRRGAEFVRGCFVQKRGSKSGTLTPTYGYPSGASVLGDQTRTRSSPGCLTRRHGPMPRGHWRS